jgi:hypothetical protein
VPFQLGRLPEIIGIEKGNELSTRNLHAPIANGARISAVGHLHQP